MTPFNPQRKSELTWGECLGPALEITDKANAKQYLNDYIKFVQKQLDVKPRDDDLTAEQIAKNNLEYYAGRCLDSNTGSRVKELFPTSLLI
ncbi:hypothetical protein KAR91_74985 [Candidatus Pacearchaeota archaeon]|nr:hypothetical protein [Candidatus Pacearchaeota archaeon]